jgi:hypothetical protein
MVIAATHPSNPLSAGSGKSKDEIKAAIEGGYKKRQISHAHRSGIVYDV